MIEAVVFDMDGTLLDTERYNVRFWCEASEMEGVPITRDEALHIRSLDSGLAAEYLEGRHPGFDYHAVREVRRRLMREHVESEGIEAKPGAPEILEMLKRRGVRTAVATGTAQQRAESYLSEVGLSPYLDLIISASKVEHGKPAPDVYLYACERLGSDPRVTIAVEDAPFGVMSALAAGCRVLAVPDLTPLEPSLAARAERTAGSLEELIPYIEGLLSERCRSDQMIWTIWLIGGLSSVGSVTQRNLKPCCS